MAKTIYQLDATTSVNRETDYILVGQQDKEKRALVKDVITPMGGLPEGFDVSSGFQSIPLNGNAGCTLNDTDFLKKTVSLRFLGEQGTPSMTLDLTDLVGQTIYFRVRYFAVGSGTFDFYTLYKHPDWEIGQGHHLQTMLYHKNDIKYFLHGWYYVSDYDLFKL